MHSTEAWAERSRTTDVARRCALVIIMSMGMRGCMEFPPVTGAPDATPGGSATDGGADALVDSPCFKCSAGLDETGPNCADQYAACKAVDKCEDLFLCGIAHDCYAAGVNLTNCIIPCGIQVGVVSLSDPAIAPLQTLIQCVSQTCSAVCSPAGGADN